MVVTSDRNLNGALRLLEGRAREPVQGALSTVEVTGLKVLLRSRFEAKDAVDPQEL